MLNNYPEIHVTTHFDGNTPAKDAFADLIIEKILADTGKALPKPTNLLYNKPSVPADHGHLDCAVIHP